MLNTVSVAFHVYIYRTMRRINIVNFNDIIKKMFVHHQIKVINKRIFLLFL